MNYRQAFHEAYCEWPGVRRHNELFYCLQPEGTAGAGPRSARRQRQRQRRSASCHPVSPRLSCLGNSGDLALLVGRVSASGRFAGGH